MQSTTLYINTYNFSAVSITGIFTCPEALSDIRMRRV